MTGRLRPGVTLAEAAAQLDVLADALAAEHPDASAHTELYVIAERYARPEPGAARHTAPLVSVVMGLASLVLRVAMANVGTLLVARGVERRQEMALRAGLGATRRRLVRQLVHRERAAGAGGRRRRRDRRGVGRRSRRRLLRHGRRTGTVATRLPRGLAGVRVHRNDGNGGRGAHRTRAGVCARRGSSWRAQSARAGRNAGGSVAGRRLTNGLVVLQVAVSMLLLVCAGLFVQSGRRAGAIDFGFRTNDLLVLSVDPLGQGYDREQARALYRDILEDVVALPGVESASWARRAPLSPGPNRGNVFTLDGGTAPEPDAVRVSLNYVDSGFFDTVDIPVLRGRGFREEDTAGDRRVALVSERAARHLWPGQDAIGRRIVHGFIGGAPFEVIGVVRDAHMSPHVAVRPAAVRPLPVRVSAPRGVGSIRGAPPRPPSPTPARSTASRRRQCGGRRDRPGRASEARPRPRHARQNVSAPPAARSDDRRPTPDKPPDARGRELAGASAPQVASKRRTKTRR